MEFYGIQSVKIAREITGEISKISFLATAKELCTAFSMISKNKNIPNPFAAPGVLGSRLSNSKSILEEAGWTVSIRHKISRGQYRHLLEKKVDGDL
ncbi:uncharacterized protein TOL2_C12650 [Desulfobacula toluolica Tol2]|uniref:Uncharacterized protein n=1 Tax=Desulfobacula toluolica (strain DSM 7467 / Tol2) TaxID=651182 RepID=K0NHY0_DESTT|nr:uncharacterized protein TOL2_C12650 [Desulfobacula toluolica Tol2]